MNIKRTLLYVSILLLQVTHAAAYPRGEGTQYQDLPQSPEYRTEDDFESTAEEREEFAIMLKKARLLHSLDKIDAALLIYYDILQRDPENTVVLEDILHIFFQTNNWAMVISTLERMIHLKPNDTRLREVLLIVYEYYQMPERELPVELDLAAIEPENPRYLSSLAESLNGYGFIDETITLYEKLHQLDPRNAEFLLRLGILYEEKFQLKKSISYFEKLAELQADPQIEMKIARLYLENNQPLAALEMYQEMLARHPEEYDILKEELGYIYVETAKFYWGHDRLAPAQEYFTLARDADYPHPFAADYLAEANQEMGLKASYAFDRSEYRFIDDITKTTQSIGVHLPSRAFFNRPELLMSTTRLEDPAYRFDIHSLHLRSNIDLNVRFRTAISIGYSEPQDAIHAGRELLYGNTWFITTDPTSTISSTITLGVERKRIDDTVEAIDKNIMSTEYFFSYSRFLLQKIWTSLDYRYKSITGGNEGHSASLDLSYVFIDLPTISEDELEKRSPLYTREKQHLGVGTNVEYITYKDTNNLYFTLDEEIFFFVRGEYARNITEQIQLAVFGSIGTAANTGEFITDYRFELGYIWPFRLNSKLSYSISDLTTTEGGVEKTYRDKRLQFDVLFYF